MSKEIFLIADTHFGHKGVCNFLRSNGEKLRPWDNPDEMDEYMVEKWNSVVRPTDKVYHLGDVVINRKALSILNRLNGDKILIKGNHDIFKLDEYAKYFRDIRAYHVMNKYIFSHIPVIDTQKIRFSGNIHGHLHDNVLDDPWYQCCSVEQIDYTPIAFDQFIKRFDI